MPAVPTERRPAADRRPAALLRGPHRLPTIGLLLVVTLVAFEALAVATAMPTAVRELHGLRLYGWAFTAFLLASVVGIVVAGEQSDARGPVGPFLAGLSVFAVGLVMAGTAVDMPVFLLGRAVQGFGAGAVLVALYVVIARVYDETLRPRVFAALSAAWVLPALIGPTVAGALTEHLSWRLVFLGLPPFVAAGLGLLLPALRDLPGAAQPAPARARARTPIALRAAAGVALLQYAGQRLRPVSLLAVGGGFALLLPAVRRLLPVGALRLRRGLPAVVVCRALAGAFFGAEAFLPLALTTLHGVRPTLAGVPLTVGALGWSAGSWWQGRRRAERPREPLIRRGFVLLAAGIASLAVVSLPGASPWLVLLAWTVAATGMGLAMPTISVLTLRLSPPAEQGANSAALQIADVLGSICCVGVGGVVLAGAGTKPAAFAAINLGMAGVATAGALLAGRLVP